MPNHNDNEQNDMILLGGLWINESASGHKYMAGRLGLGGKVLIFRNKNKTNENQPDYHMFLARQQRQNGDGEDDDIEF